MTRQRGFTWVGLVAILVAAAAFIAAVYGLVHYVGSYIDDVRAEGFKAGRTAALKEVGDRDNKSLLDAKQEIDRLEKRVKELEDAAEDELAVASAQYEEEKTHDEATIADLTRRVRAGELKLRDPGRIAQNQGSAPVAGAAQGASPAPAPGAGSGHEGGGELSDPASEFLLGEAARADATVKRLNLCKATVKTYLKTCNAAVDGPN